MSTVSATTPIELVEGVYATLPERAGPRPRAPRPTADADREDPHQPPHRPEGQELERGASYADFHPDRVAMQDATAQMALLQFMTAGLPEVAVPSTVHCDHLIQAKVGANDRPRRGHRHQPGGLRLPALGVGEVRHRLLGPGQRDHPPGRARELRLPRRDDDRHRLPHAQRRRARHGRHRRRRRRRRRRDDRVPVQRPLAEGHRRPADRRAVAAGRARRTSSSRSPGCSPSRAAPGRSSSTTAPAPTPSRPPARARSATWAPRSAPRRRCSRTTPTWPPTSRRPAARRSPTPPTRSPTTCAPTTGRSYDQLIEIDLDELKPLINGPHSPDRAHRVGAEVGAAAAGERLAARDLLGAHRVVHQLVLRGHHAAPRRSPARRRRRGSRPRSSCSSRPARSRSAPRSSATACSPTSRRSAPRCSPTPAARASASGRGPTSITGQPNTIVNSYNRNFPKRNDGSAKTLSFVTSPDTVMALALAGRLDFDPTTDTLTAPDGTEVTLEPPVGEVLPDRGYDPGEDTFTAPPADGCRRRRSRSAPTATGCSCSSRSRRGTARTTSACPC